MWCGRKNVQSNVSSMCTLWSGSVFFVLWTAKKTLRYVSSLFFSRIFFLCRETGVEHSCMQVDTFALKCLGRGGKGRKVWEEWGVKLFLFFLTDISFYYLWLLPCSPRLPSLPLSFSPLSLYVSHSLVPYLFLRLLFPIGLTSFHAITFPAHFVSLVILFHKLPCPSLVSRLSLSCCLVCPIFEFLFLIYFDSLPLFSFTLLDPTVSLPHKIARASNLAAQSVPPITTLFSLQKQVQR